MSYKTNLPTGQTVFIANEDGQTLIALKSETSNQIQSSRFSTGDWSHQPKIFQTDKGALVQLETKEGSIVIELAENAIHRLQETPELDTSKALPLHKASASEVASFKTKPMKSMEPMKPMKPMN